MIDLLEAAREVQDFCNPQGWRFCFIGGLAVLRWGETRVTLDVDLNVLTGFGGEDQVIDSLLHRFEPRVPGAREFARRNRVLLLNTHNAIGIDVSLAAVPFEELVIVRASTFRFDIGIELRTCSAEDLIVMKLFASRPGDIRDVEGVAIRNRGKLDWNYVEEHLTPLAELKCEPKSFTNWLGCATSFNQAIGPISELSYQRLWHPNATGSGEFHPPTSARSRD